jgi:hypothetical protein
VLDELVRHDDAHRVAAGVVDRTSTAFVFCVAPRGIVSTSQEIVDHVLRRRMLARRLDGDGGIWSLVNTNAAGISSLGFEMEICGGKVRIQCAHQDSNLGPLAPEANALSS